MTQCRDETYHNRGLVTLWLSYMVQILVDNTCLYNTIYNTGFPQSWKILEKIVVMENNGKVIAIGKKWKIMETVIRLGRGREGTLMPPVGILDTYHW